MRRTLVTLILFFACLTAAAAPVTVASARVWPGSDYTRITFETAKPVGHKMTMMKNPDRLVIDLENVELNAALKTLAEKVQGGDSYVRNVRAAVFKPGIVRVVIDLKQEAKPSFFALKPAGGYKHRLVLDIYPKVDPLMALLEPQGNASGEQTGGWSPDAAPASASEMATAPEPVESLADTTNEPETPQTPEAGIAREGVDRLVTVAIDAGHGGEDSGARGANGSYEKDITLTIAKKLKSLIDAEPNMRGVLTRDSDYFIPLHGRVVKARKLQADLFVSVHADAFVRQDARGSSVFALSERGATSAMARLLAKHENESDLIGGVNIDSKDPYLTRTLLDLSQTATISDSLKLAKAVLGHLGEINDLHKGAVEQAGFAVLKSPDIPSILVETAFISNPEEERRLNDDDYQTKMATAILSGIKRYFASNPPLSKSKKLVFND
jgi:N-acetylmuramoyl-L-alanine amidase